jgi:hypothetical protein
MSIPRVFISYSSSDLPYVKVEIIPIIEECGIEFWYDQSGIKTVDHWERSILKGLETCDWFIIVMTPRSAESEWVKDELHWAFDHLPGGRIIPIMVEACDPAWFHIRLPRIQFIDLRQGRDISRMRLASIWGVEAPQPDFTISEVQSFGGHSDWVDCTP